MLSNNIVDYADQWTKTRRYILAPVQDNNGKSKLVIYYRFAFMFAVVPVHNKLVDEIIEKMISANVEVRSSPIDWKKEFKLERLWTDRLDEFAIVPGAIDKNKLLIFHKEFCEYVLLSNMQRGKYRQIVRKMLSAGAEKWEKRPDVCN